MPDSMGLLMQMTRDLSAKVDKMASEQVTRYEFSELASRIDKFVLHSEFEQYKLYATSAAAAFADSINSKLREGATRFDAIEVKLPTGRFPQWAIAAIIAVVAAVVGGVSSSVMTHNYQTQQSVSTSQTYTQTYNQAKRRP